MVIITKIESQKNKARVNIFVDGAFFCGLNKETAVICGLKENKVVDEKELKKAVFESEVKSAFEKSLDYLARCMHSQKEVADKLKTKGFEEEVIETAINKLQEYHYIDDRLFAKQFVNSYNNKSKKVLQEKLFLKGISRDIISEIIEERDPEQEIELCKAQAEKYIKSKPINSYNDYQKMLASLLRKGFDFDVIKQATKHIKNENNFGE